MSLFPPPHAPSGTRAAEVIKTAAGLVEGVRQGQHGDKVENHQNIADMFNGYLGVGPKGQLRWGITPGQAALMVACLKIARTKLGDHNPDDFVDLAGYAGIACEIAERWHPPPTTAPAWSVTAPPPPDEPLLDPDERDGTEREA